jgi:predicted ATPase/DNA-binding SARP family transcriptional activator
MAFVCWLMLTYGVLGVTEVHDGDVPIDLGGPLPRRLLTALIAAGGHPVPDERLADAVWIERLPSNPASALQVYVSRLRRSLRAAGGEVLQRARGGYRLVTAAGAIDVDRFTRHVAQARALLDDDRAGHALHQFDTALALWRGEPFADLSDSPAVLAARARLHELRDTAVEGRPAARLAIGDAPSAVPELDAAVHAAPYRERRWALLVLALYRCGRQGDALNTLRRVRGLLADDLGVDPGPELQRLERQVLAQDPHLLLPEPADNRSTQPPRKPSPLTPPLSSFVGRQGELAMLAGLVDGHRLVTLTGPAGAGKTRLAVQYAASRTDPDGPWLVRLADVTDPQVVALTVAAALGVSEVAGDPRHAMAAALGARDGLLLLDNCEHLAAAVAGVLVDLLSRCTGLHVLATSRQPLGIDGERVLPVGPLPMQSAVALLVDRITTIRPGWTPTAGDLHQAHRLAAALDGLPLALELAAARARVLGLRELTEHLDDRFAVLGTTARGSLSPHATLDAAIAWSVDLLSAADQALLLRLWPFEGGFTLEAAEAIQPDAPSAYALQTLSSLVTRSIVVADTTVTPSRYRLLETIRAHCRTRDPDPDTSRAAHAAWVRRLVAGRAQELRGERSAHAIRIMARELPNLRTGIAYDLVTTPTEALRTVGLLDWFWYRGARLAEGRRLLTAALAAAPDAPPVDVARAWSAYATLHYLAGDLLDSVHALDKATQTLGNPHDREGRTLQGQLRYYQALLRLSMDDTEAAHWAATESVRIGRDVAQEWIIACGEMTLGATLVAQGRAEDGRETLRAATRRALACGQVWTAAMSDLLLARSVLAAADPADPADAALPLLRRALRRFHQEDDLSNVLAVLHTGALALAAADHSEQAAQLRAAVHQHAVRHGLRPEQTDQATATALNAILGPLQPVSTTGGPPAWETTLSLLAHGVVVGPARGGDAEAALVRAEGGEPLLFGPVPD